jgi:hypothetical protein
VAPISVAASNPGAEEPPGGTARTQFACATCEITEIYLGGAEVFDQRERREFCGNLRRREEELEGFSSEPDAVRQ